VAESDAAARSQPSARACELTFPRPPTPVLFPAYAAVLLASYYNSLLSTAKAQLTRQLLPLLPSSAPHPIADSTAVRSYASCAAYVVVIKHPSRCCPCSDTAAASGRASGDARAWARVDPRPCSRARRGCVACRVRRRASGSAAAHTLRSAQFAPGCTAITGTHHAALQQARH
jgi:hypothetical protein